MRDAHPSSPPPGLRRGLPALGVALTLIVIFIAVLAIPLAAAQELGLSEGETTSWLMAIYGVSGVMSLLLVWRYRQPLLVTGNVFVLIFVASLGGQLPWAELVGASMVAGAIVLVLGPLGVTHRLAGWLPSPIVFGLLAGAVLPFFVNLFTALGADPLVVGGTLASYLAGRRWLEPRIPAILAALVVGLVVSAVAGELGPAPGRITWPSLTLTAPVFSLRALLTAGPVMIVLITLQANVPSMVFLRTQGYRPPEQAVSATSGVGTVLGSLLGPIGVSLSLPATALCAGPDAGDQAVRHWSAYIAGTAGVLIALLAGLATDLAAVVPPSLLTAGVGLAVVGVLSNALQEVVRGPLLLGPMFAFGIALSGLTLLGLGPFFWALLIGLVVSRVLEPNQWKDVHEKATATLQP